MTNWQALGAASVIVLLTGAVALYWFMPDFLAPSGRGQNTGLARNRPTKFTSNRRPQSREQISFQNRPPRKRIDDSAYRRASTRLPALPPGARIIAVDSQVKNGLRETAVKLESEATPLELELFYTDRLVKDWIILRDSLTESIGWSGVFMQIGERESRLGIFAVVRTGPGPGSVSTKISILLAEEA